MGLDKESISTEKKRLLSKELSRDERIKWLGEPDPYRSMFPLTDRVLMGFGLTSVFGIVGTMVYGAYSIQPNNGTPFLGWALAILFLTAGIILILDPIWNYLIAKKAIYAITTKRAIIIDGLIFRRVRSFKKRDVARPELICRKGEFWDVILASKQLGYSDRKYKSTLGDNDIGFKRIKNPKQIKNMLKTIRR